MPRIIRAVVTAAVLTVAVSALWAWSTVLTSAGPVPVPQLTRSPASDYRQLAGAVTGDATAFFAVDAALCSACFAVTFRRGHR